jgi:hypothetical protein
MKNKLLLATVCFLTLIASIKAQNYEWAQHIKASNDASNLDSELSKICTDNENNLLVLAYISGSFDLDTTSAENLIGVSSGYPYLIKYSSLGEVLYYKQLVSDNNWKNYSSDIAIDADNNIFICGYFSGTTNFNPGGEAYNMTATDDAENMFLLKLNSLGEFQWAKQYGTPQVTGGTTPHINPNAMKIKGNYIYIVGGFKGKVQFDSSDDETIFESASSNVDIFVQKLSLEGNNQWVYTAGGDEYDEATAVDIDNIGDVYVAGEFTGTVDFGTDYFLDELSSGISDASDVFIIKIRNEPYPDGFQSVTYASAIGGTGGKINAQSILADTDSTVFYSGIFASKADFNPFGLTEYYLETSETYGLDSYLASLNKSGGFNWATQNGSNYDSDDMDELEFNSGLFLNNDNIYRLNKLTINVFSKSTQEKKFSTVTQNFGGNSTGVDMAVDQIGNIYVLGKFNGDLSLKIREADGSFSSPWATYSSNDNEDILIYKFSALGGPATNISFSLNEITLEEGKTFQLNYMLDPEDAFTNFRWDGGNFAIAELFDGGMVKAVSEGKTWVCVTDKNTNLSDTCWVTVVKEGTVSVNEHSLANIEIFPNPVQNYIQLAGNDLGSISNIEIYNLQGMIIKSLNYANTNSISVSDLYGGVYFLKIYTANKIATFKFIKN